MADKNERTNKNVSETVRLVRLIKPRSKAYLAGLLGCSLIDSSVSLVLPLLVKVLLDTVTGKSMASIWIVCLVFFVVIASLVILTPLFQYLFNKAVKSTMIDLRMTVFHHIQKLPVSYFENTHSGDSMSRINNDLGVIENAFTGNIRSILSLLISGGSSAIIMLLLDWRLASLLIAMGFISTYVNTRFAKPLRQISAAIQKSAGTQVELLSEMIAGTQVSRMFQMTGKMEQEFSEKNEQLTRLSIARTVRNASLNTTNYTLSWINNGIIFMVGSWMVMHGKLTLGTLISLILLLEHVTNLFSRLGNLWVSLQSSLAGAERVFELLDVAEEPKRYEAIAGQADDTKNSGEGIIEFRNGSFAYDEGAKVLDGLSFSVQKGQVAALIGASGGGKSTIIKLLLGFYPLGQGDIRIEGKRFADYTLSELRDKMAYVSQDACLIEGTIEENIRYGRRDATFEEVVIASRAANAHDFIMEQVDGYGTAIGERGARLSGGQKQRIAIARALLKNAPILLLDEATSALDSESEQAVQQGLQRLMEGKTTIAVAHRLSTIKQANVIYVIDQGKIVEQGNHNELLELGGVYRRLYAIQERHSEAMPVGS